MATKKTKAAAPKSAPKTTTKKTVAAKPAKATKKAAKVAAEEVDLFEKTECTSCACSAPAKKAAKAAAPKGTRVLFHVRAEAGSKVYIAGCFNDWNPTSKPMTDKDGTGDYSVTLTLKPGTYQYKFVINGTWCADPECTEWVPNDMGTLNSVCVVK